uniref:Uncharacterized protein n=1 Tax=Rhizophora mucronata TaxID=61149 RepID=A0A2P2QL86_RHIMU
MSKRYTLSFQMATKPVAGSWFTCFCSNIQTQVLKQSKKTNWIRIKYGNNFPVGCHEKKKKPNKLDSTINQMTIERQKEKFEIRLIRANSCNN